MIKTIKTKKFVYKGSVKNGKPEGRGTLKWISGEERKGNFYVGKFKNGKFN